MAGTEVPVGITRLMGEVLMIAMKMKRTKAKEQTHVSSPSNYENLQYRAHFGLEHIGIFVVAY